MVSGKAVKRYFLNFLISIDQLLNTLFGGSPDETISSRWGRIKDKNKVAKIGCAILDVVDKNHCKDSVEFKDGKPDPHHLPPPPYNQEF